MGFRVLLVGRKLPDSLPLQKRIYRTKQFRLMFKRGPLFYAEYNSGMLFIDIIHSLVGINIFYFGNQNIRRA